MSRDWQEDMETALKSGYDKQQIAVYWLNEAKQAKNDKAHWMCKHTAAEQKYLTQSNVISELRKKVEFWESQYNSASDDGDEATRQRDAEVERADKAEEREQKLKEAVKKSIHCIDMEAFRTACNVLEDTLSSLYSFNKEETTNEMDPL